MIVGIVAGVLVVVVAVGALVVFLGRDDNQAVGPTQPQPQNSQPLPSQGLPSEGQRTEPGPSTPAEQPRRLAESKALTVRFLGYLNTRKEKEAAALGCAESKQILPGVILLTVDESTKLKAGNVVAEESAETGLSMRTNRVEISGTVKFNPHTGYVRLQDVPGKPVCVQLFITRATR